jgi:hypothetical protein
MGGGLLVSQQCADGVLWLLVDGRNLAVGGDNRLFRSPLQCARRKIRRLLDEAQDNGDFFDFSLPVGVGTGNL